jgi:hypothetical protein
MPQWPRRSFGRQRPLASNNHLSSGDLSREELVNELRMVIALFEAGRDQEAVARPRPLAQAGHQDARFLLGARYFERGDLKAVEALLRGIATGGRAKAVYLLDAIYRSLHHDEEKVRPWSRVGGARSYAACVFEADTCAIHDGDLGLAKFRLGRGAVSGNTDAMVNFGSLLPKKGLGSARPQWKRPADRGHSAAIQNLRTSFGGSHGE